MNYHQLTSGERYMLSALRMQGLNQSQIARQLGRHRSTICRELKRNCARFDGHYRPSKAIERTNGRRSRSRRNLHFTLADLHQVNALLSKQWSPQQVSGHLRRKGVLRISHETIYRHVWDDKACGGSLYIHLRGARKNCRKRYGRNDSRGRLAGKRHISERPASAQARRRIGHWEIDTVIGAGSQHCIVSLVERKSGYVLIGKLEARTVEQLNRATLRIARRHADQFDTITADNGSEFHGYAFIEQALGKR
jgi:IS30 family transposase